MMKEAERLEAGSLIGDFNHMIERLRFQHLAVLMTVELFLLGVAFPDARN